MSFLNATLILGTLAAVVPVVLHLIARREPKKVTFPSIQFLTKRFESNRSRLRVRRWWLLAMRIAAIAALAVALARPAIHQSVSVTWFSIALIAAAGLALLVMATVAVIHDKSRAMRYVLAGSASVLLGGSLLWGAVTYALGPSVAIDDSGPIALAIVVDNSPTSGWKKAGDDRMRIIKEVAAGVISKLPRTSRVAVLDRSATPASFSLDVAGAISKLESMQPIAQARSIAARIDSAARLVRTSELENRQVLLLTDMTQSTWDQAALQSPLAETLAASPAFSLTVFDTGGFVGTNYSLESLKLSDPSPPAQAQTALTVTLRSETLGETNSSDSELSPSDELDAVSGMQANSVTVELQMYQSDSGLPVVRDGEVVYPSLVSVDRTTSTLASGDAAELVLTIPGLPVGTHHGLVRISNRDALAVDDQRFFTVTVRDASPVLLVAESIDEAVVIEAAINFSDTGGVQSGAQSGVPSNAEFSVERIGFADLGVARLSDYQAIVLVDPPAEVLRDSAVGDYLAGGGGVMVTLGPSLGVDAPKSDWLPTLVRPWRTADDGVFFQVNDAISPVTDSLAGDTPWNDFRVFQYWQAESTAADTVLIRYTATGHIAMLERVFKSDGSDAVGKLLVLTTPLPALSDGTRDWNRLFGVDPWPAWLLTWQSIDYLTGRRGNEAMTTVGTPLTIELQVADEGAPGEKQVATGGAPDGFFKATRLQLFPPGGSPPIPIDAAVQTPQVTIAEVGSPGVYWLKGNRSGAGFSANLASGAIDLA